MADSSPRLSSLQTEVLIKLYKDHEVLWNRACPVYKEYGARRTSLQSMQDAFKAATGITLPISIIKTKLQSFRTSFGREHNLVMQSIQNGKQVYEPKYEHYQRLSFLKAVINQRPRSREEDGANTTLNTHHTVSEDGLPATQELQGLQDLEDFQDDIPVNNDSLGDDDDIDDNDDGLSCDLSCESVADDKLIERNGDVKQGRDVAQESDDIIQDGLASPSRGLLHSLEPASVLRHGLADGDRSLPSHRPHGLKKRMHENETRLNMNYDQHGGKRRHTVDETDGCLDDIGMNVLKRQEEGQGEQLIKSLMGYLVERMRRRENRRREEEARERDEASRSRSEDKLWARHLVQQLSEITDHRKKQLLKLKISQMVLECRMEELEKE